MLVEANGAADDIKSESPDEYVAVSTTGKLSVE